jgi:hypothetical protein
MMVSCTFTMMVYDDYLHDSSTILSFSQSSTLYRSTTLHWATRTSTKSRTTVYLCTMYDGLR